MSYNESKNNPKKTLSPSDTLSNKQGHDNKNEKKVKKHFWRDWEPMEKFTFVIAIFTIIYSIVTIGLYRISRQTLMVSQKSFVYCKEVNMLSNVDKSGKINVEKPSNIVMLLANSGETPARKVVIYKTYYINNGDVLPKNFKYPLSGDSQAVETWIAPKSESTIMEALPANLVYGVDDFKKYLFVYGYITYTDIFNIPHRNDFCFKRVATRINMATREVEKHIFANCESHNCYDDDCHNY